MAEVGRVLWRQPSTTPFLRVSYSKLLGTTSSQVLSISKDRASTSSLENLFQCLTILTG